ncbi:MAG: DUF4252 domain-containing protein [Prevotella sp.]|nr:DUF4252 domain-containing protein [Prevotella sp.]MDE6354754.1 DUF4252 domain-containing protein [Prevotella sp.]
MRRAVFLAIAAIMAVTVSAQGVQDFASRFVRECDVDTAIQCITVSPKMMEQLTRKAGTDNNESMAQAIQKLRSARIVTTSTHCETYYRQAENLLKKNAQRFKHNKDYRNGHGHGTFYTRKTRNGDTVELVMLHADTDSDILVIVNLTGDIDEEFISTITRTFGNRKSDID